MSDDQSVNEAIETYRQQLTAEAELARGDLDEIEDHMRTLIDELPLIGIGAALVAGAGIVLRARWAAPAAAACAVALASMGPMLLDLTWRFEHPDLQRAIFLGILGLGVAGAALGAVFAWRNARSNLGTLKYVLG